MLKVKYTTLLDLEVRTRCSSVKAELAAQQNFYGAANFETSKSCITNSDRSILKYPFVAFIDYHRYKKKVVCNKVVFGHSETAAEKLLHNIFFKKECLKLIISVWRRVNNRFITCTYIICVKGLAIGNYHEWKASVAAMARYLTLFFAKFILERNVLCDLRNLHD